MNCEGQITISARGRRRDRFYLWFMALFWVAWAPMTIAVTWAAIKHFNLFLIVWLVFGYAGTVFIPIAFLHINREEKICVDSKGIVVQSGWLSCKASFIGKDDIDAVTFERYQDAEGPESVFTLNVIRKSGWLKKRTMLAWSLHPAEKQKVYVALTELMRRNGLQFREVNTYEPPNQAL